MTLPDLKPFFDWLQIHPYLAGLITYFVCFLECLVMIGFLVPGTVFMTAIGTLIGIGVLHFTPIVLWAIAGAITGDVLSFWIGRYYHHYTKNFSLFRRYPKLLRKGEAFFDKHGGKSIFFGRFFGPIRAILPFIAGMVRMPCRQFLVADIISAIAWAPAYMLPGILLGQASQQLPPEIATKLIIFVVLLLLFIWLVYAFIKSCYAWFSRLLDKQVAYLWHFTRNHPKLKTITSILTDYRHPHSHAQLALALTSVFCAFGFLLTAFSVAHHGLATYLNEPIYHLMRSLRQENLDLFFIAMAELSPRVLCVFWLVMLGFFLVKRNYWLSLHWGLAGLLSYGFGSLFKHILHIARPIGLVKIPLGASFPSGHTVSSISILGFFAVLIAIEKSKNQRMIIYGLTSLIIISVMLSRIYLTAHWFSDVLGGTLLAISILAGLTLSYRRKLDHTTISSGKIAILGVLILLVCWGTNLAYGYKKLLSNSQLIYSEQTINVNKWWKDAKFQTPIYRVGHFGQKIEILNIQWAGKLADIQNYLEKQAWHTIPKEKIFTTLYKLSLHVKDPNVPLFISANAGQAPTLTMTKYFPTTHNLLVLNLWNSHKLFCNGIPLWLGLVHYHKTWHLQFQPLKKQTVTQPFVPADQQFLHDLKSYTVKNVNYPDSQVSVLFIK
ncbi:MAG: phosphatase PAP2 family protein [Gammaproteobacteria bacterium]|nr:MAG: phosphatase PAP2 family protein [Gammaproteobacteria bacterium]